MDCVADWSRDEYEMRAGSGNSVDCVAGWLIDKYEVKAK